MKVFNLRNILSALIALLLVHGVIDYFSYQIGIVVLLVISGMIWVVADGLEKIAKVMRAATEQLQKK
ncbi:hypothetical protein GMB70_14825 [Turicibacter sanguinis]|uniref:hypothetical protein n=1 Tax=Turicibacter sanguinis TaxID=154288 RepID=UPI0012BC4784|nr:hypothetical protein [Turicibacter sanguinis]MCU7201585.1 hypothetical protein [Turicibacter sanguinis]MTP79912.1 hypothetical protein [Turicibacter sanguinis]